ncbi:CENP-Q, a CENPA-CAD centromere complex subunit-domain-containing protein [Trichophaea hybrida]|nr:CENP-Q, a CENPA-CAD centromere complex subunit-domain-containing protein [Trichophaea hybrida]
MPRERQRKTAKPTAGPPAMLRKRKAPEPESDAESDESGESDDSEVIAKAPVLREILRDIPRSDFKKWSPPSEKMQEDIQEILRAAERPAIMTFRKERARTEAQRAIQELVVKLQNSFKKTPIPGMGKDVPLSYEKLVHKITEWEAILEPTLRHNADLERNLAQQKARLAKDEKDLKILQANAKGQERIRAGQNRMLPQSLRVDPRNPILDTIDDINMPRCPGAASSYDINSDRQIRPYIAQLRSHLQSMQTNAHALNDVPESILRGRAAVEEVLVRAGPSLRNSVLGV